MIACFRANNITTENGFIPVDKLGEVLDELDLRTKVGGDSGLQALQAYLEVSQSSTDFFSFMQSHSYV